ncbi:hypothetical protein X926_04785 [Petrotoga sp. HWHPT.55.6.3]|nr:hypothetical protein X926_04785 [Petrotoga sp. HWHPT.55.6.3]
MQTVFLDEFDFELGFGDLKGRSPLMYGFMGPQVPF